MKGIDFPIYGTKVKGVTQEFDLASPAGRKKYFEAKTGDEIAHIKKYFKNGNTFVAFFLGKKNSGKGTYSKLFIEIFGEQYIAHISVGDVVREVHADLKNKRKAKKILSELEQVYRGFISFDEAIERFMGRSQDKLLPTEFILALLKYYIAEHEGKTIFIDGLPRELDQVSYSLYFRDLINYRHDPDVFILIDIPESVIEARFKYRVICPVCKTSRSTMFNITSKAGYDEKAREYYLICDNPDCPKEGKARLVRKVGDDAGLESVRARLDKDEEIMRKAFSLHGVPKILLRNHVPINKFKRNYDDYENSTMHEYSRDKNGNVKMKALPWTIKDDEGIESYSLLAPAVVVSMIKQLVDVLDL